MSVLKREMCKNDMPPFADDVQFAVQGIKESNESSDLDDHDLDDFEEPSSLKSLPDNKRSTMSDDSDALFHSAELDFPGVEDFRGTPKSNKSGGSVGKYGSSPIAIKGGGSMSFHKVSTRSLGHSDPATNKSTSVCSLPLIVTTDTSGTSCGSSREGNLSPGSTGSNINARSLSEAIKTTQVLENIHDAPDLVKTTKHGIAQLREQFHHIQSELTSSKEDFDVNVGDMKESLLQMLVGLSQNETASRDGSDCTECHMLQQLEEKHATERQELNAELNGLKDKYLEVLSEKDRICMQITSLEEKCAACADENKLLKDARESGEEQHVTRVADLEAEIIKNGTVMGKLNKQIEELNAKLAVSAENGTRIGNLHEEIKDLTVQLEGKREMLNEVTAERDSLAEALQKNSLEIAEKNRELSELVLGKESVVSEFDIAKVSLEESEAELQKVKQQFEMYKMSRQNSIDSHLEQVMLPHSITSVSLSLC